MMLAGSSTSASTLSTDTNPASSTPARPSRLRGLSYLRNYTHHHFHNSNSTPTSPQEPKAPSVSRAETTCAFADPVFPEESLDHDHESSARWPHLLGLRESLTSSPPAHPPDRSPFGSPFGWHPSAYGSTATAAPPTSELQPLSTITSTRPSRTATDTDFTMTRNRTMVATNGARVSSTATQTTAGSSTAGSATLRQIPISGHSVGELDSDLLHERSATLNNINGHLPSIQFIPASEPQRNRPSLDFTRITRTLPNHSSIIRVGRYSERDSASESAPTAPSDAPIGFKSKVVSRRHCEFSFSGSQWYIKDVKSSSGTFLNHIRLSQPGLESRLYPVNDGDIVQLGIDFKGGEENIFRCVKIRIETNRGWQRGLNKFNKSTHKQLQQLARRRKKDSDTASKHSTECTICLNSIAPCQALFVAPCSHTWHYKCIRNLLDDAKYPHFLCPNCRAQTDLSVDIEEDELEDFEQYDDDEQDSKARVAADAPEQKEDTILGAAEAEPTTLPNSITPSSSHGIAGFDLPPRGKTARKDTSDTIGDDRDISWALNYVSNRDNSLRLASLDDTITSSRHPGRGLNPSASAFVPSPSSSAPTRSPQSENLHPMLRSSAVAGADEHESDDTVPDMGGSEPSRPRQIPTASAQRTVSIDALGRDGPMTPRNTAGPFVLDGGADDADSDGNSRQSSNER